MGLLYGIYTVCFTFYVIRKEDLFSQQNVIIYRKLKSGGIRCVTSSHIYMNNEMSFN